MHEVMAGYVERGEVPGLVTLVSRRGELHVDAIGVKAINGAALERGTICRISSMSKGLSRQAYTSYADHGCGHDDPWSRSASCGRTSPVDRLLHDLAP